MDLKFKYNPEVDDVEIVLGDKVVDTIGQEVVRSWVEFYNSKHGYAKPVEEVVTPTEEETNDNQEQAGSSGLSTEDSESTEQPTTQD